MFRLNSKVWWVFYLISSQYVFCFPEPVSSAKRSANIPSSSTTTTAETTTTTESTVSSEIIPATEISIKNADIAEDSPEDEEDDDDQSREEIFLGDPIQIPPEIEHDDDDDDDKSGEEEAVAKAKKPYKVSEKKKKQPEKKKETDHDGGDDDESSEETILRPFKHPYETNNPHHKRPIKKQPPPPPPKLHIHHHQQHHQSSYVHDVKGCNGPENFIQDVGIVTFLWGFAIALIIARTDLLPAFNQKFHISDRFYDVLEEELPQDSWTSQNYDAIVNAVTSKISKRSLPSLVPDRHILDRLTRLGLSARVVSMTGVVLSFVSLFPKLLKRVVYGSEYWLGSKGPWNKFIRNYKCQGHHH